MGIWYITREAVMSSLEVNATARSNRIIDQKIETASRNAESLTHRKFYPELRTMTFDWPNFQYAPAWKLWLDEHELISVTSFTSGGTTLVPGQYFLRPDDGPPFTHIEINLGTSAAFSAGVTFQRTVSITGVYGFDNKTALGGNLAGNITNVATTLDVAPVNNVLDIGVGSLLNIGNEKIVTTARLMITSGQTLQTPITKSQAITTVAVTDGTTFGIEEIILLDAERMKIIDIAGNNLIVRRAFDGTVLADHIGSTIYVARRFVVLRGQLGSTAAAHNLNDPMNIQVYPGPIQEVSLAETVVMLEQNSSAYARTVGAGDNQREAPGLGLEDARAKAVRDCGRKSRLRAI